MIKIKSLLYGPIIVLIISCHPIKQHILSSKIEKQITLLNPDVLYKNVEDKKFCQELKDTFMLMYFNANRNCFVDEIEVRYANNSPKPGANYRKFFNIKLPLVLWCPTKDSALIIFIYSIIAYDGNGSVLTGPKGEILKAYTSGFPVRLIKKNEKWMTVCKPIRYCCTERYDSLEKNSWVEKELIHSIIHGSYFKKDDNPDPTFWYRFFNDETIFSKNLYREKWPIND